MTSYSDAIRAGDVIDFCELIWRKSERAIAYGTGLGGSEEPEPVKAVSAFGAIPYRKGE